jgi:hypothetical protein
MNLVSCTVNKLLFLSFNALKNLPACLVLGSIFVHMTKKEVLLKKFLDKYYNKRHHQI